MKKLRFIALVIAAVLCIGLLASCGNDGKQKFDQFKFAEVFGSTAEESGSIESLKLPENCKFERCYDTDIAVLAETKTDENGSYTLYHYYDLITEKTIFTINVDTHDLRSCNWISGQTVLFVELYDEKNYETKCYLYDNNGNVLSEGDWSIRYEVEKNGSFLIIGEDVYYNDSENAKLEKLCKKDKLIDGNGSYYYLSNLKRYGDYFISGGSYYGINNAKTIKWYNKSFEQVASHTVSGLVKDFEIFPLDNGSIFVETTTAKDPATDDYDALINGFKVNVDHYVFNPETKETKTVDLRGKVAMVLNDSNMGYMPGFSLNEETIENMVFANAIIDKKVVEKELIFVSMDNDGKLGKTLPDLFDGETYLAEQLSEEYFVAFTINGDGYILDSEGKVVLELQGTDVEATGYGIVVGGVIYDYNLEKKLDLSGEDVNVIIEDSESIVYSERSESEDGEVSYTYYRYTKDGKTKIEINGCEITYVTSISDSVYAISYTNESNVEKTNYYSYGGKLLLEGITGGFSWVGSLSDGSEIYSYYSETDEATVYVKVK